MNGTWKENVAGYSKDNRRKKQTRKHTLKDVAKWHIRHSDAGYRKKKTTPSIRVEGGIETTLAKVPVKKELYVSVYIVDVDNYDYELKADAGIFGVAHGFFEGNNKTAFKYKNRFYDYYTKEPIEGIVKVLNLVDTMYLDWDEGETKYERDGWCSASSTETLFLYGKPLPVDYWNIFGFWSTKGRKYAQKKANRADRMAIKTWIENKDISKEVKTHALSKSIAWEIY